MVDTTKVIATAQRLITANGRSVRLIRYNEVSTDPDKPWRGPGDPRQTPRAILDIHAAFVSPSSASSLGLSTDVNDLLKRSTQIMVLSGGADEDLLQYNEVLDDEKYWKIEGVETLRPGADILLTFIGVSR